MYRNGDQYFESTNTKKEKKKKKSSYYFEGNKIKEYIPPLHPWIALKSLGFFLNNQPKKYETRELKNL